MDFIVDFFFFLATKELVVATMLILLDSQGQVLPILPFTMVRNKVDCLPLTEWEYFNESVLEKGYI